MKLSLLHEANFIPRQNPSIAIRQQLGSEQSKMAKYPKRSGGTSTPTGDPDRDKLMGVQNPHATRGDKIGRPQSDGGRPYRSGKTKGPKRRQDDAVGSDSNPATVIAAEEAPDAEDYPVDKEWPIAGTDKMGEKSGTHRSNRAPSQTSVGRMWGNRYPGRKV